METIGAETTGAAADAATAAAAGAAAAAVACVLGGYCKQDTDITVKLKGGDLIVRYHGDGSVTLTGNVEKIYEGKVEF